MIVAPCAAHTSWADVVGDDVAAIGELLLADTADAVLSWNLAVQHLPHLTARTEFSVPPRMKPIIDATDSDLVDALLSGDWLPATAEAGVMNGTDLGTTQPHVASSRVPEISEWDVEQLVSLAGPADRAYPALTRETLRISTAMASIDEEIARIEQAATLITNGETDSTRQEYLCSVYLRSRTLTC